MGSANGHQRSSPAQQPPVDCLGNGRCLPHPKIVSALKLLLEARCYAEQLQLDVWEFAVEIDEFRQLDLTTNDFRWLAGNGYVQHEREITQYGEPRRVFRPTGRLTFSKRTCFVLTDEGANLARRLDIGSAETVPAGEDAGSELHNARVVTDKVPQWDSARREFRWYGRLVKRFKLPSPNQETILTAFQEEGWPPRIDDPLPFHPAQDSKRRLHDTIRSLNRNQKEFQIRFKGDGTGEGVLWEPLPSNHLQGH